MCSSDLADFRPGLPGREELVPRERRLRLVRVPEAVAHVQAKNKINKIILKRMLKRKPHPQGRRIKVRRLRLCCHVQSETPGRIFLPSLPASLLLPVHSLRM